MAFGTACFEAASPETTSTTHGSASSSSTASKSKSSSSSTGSKSGASSTSSTAASAPSPSGGYSVSGASILDASGKPHVFRGADRSGLEFDSAGTGFSQGDYIVMAQWGANVVRLSLCQDYWLSDPSNGNYDPTYAATVDQQVQWAEGQGLDVILDLHTSDRGDYTVAPAAQQMPDAHSVTFWQEVAAKYMNDPHVLFELYNEPILYGGSTGTGQTSGSNFDPWAVWSQGGDSSSATGGPPGFANSIGMQTLYNTVRATGAQNLVVIGGIHNSYDLSGVPTHKINGTNIIYNTHPYDFSDKQPSTWYESFGALSATYPVIATEFGNQQSGVTNGQCDTTYLSEFVQYANKTAVSGTTAPANILSWTAWAFYVDTTADECHYPTILQDYYDLNVNGVVVVAALDAGIP
jgi:hypothetical protein